MKVYQCISAVQEDIAKVGIAKDRKNTVQGFSFRGIDDVYNVLAPVLAKHKLVILPRMVTRSCVERTSRSGSAQFFVVVEAEFDFVAAEDGTKHTVKTFGEAQDSGDKATNKAMSAAYKYAAFQTFCIPTEGDNDADATVPEPTVPAAVGDPQAQGYTEWLTDLEAIADQGTAALKAAYLRSKVEYRRRLEGTDQAKVDALRQRAERAQGGAA